MPGGAAHRLHPRRPFPGGNEPLQNIFFDLLIQVECLAFFAPVFHVVGHHDLNLPFSLEFCKNIISDFQKARNFVKSRCVTYAVVLQWHAVKSRSLKKPMKGAV